MFRAACLTTGVSTAAAFTVGGPAPRFAVASTRSPQAAHLPVASDVAQSAKAVTVGSAIATTGASVVALGAVARACKLSSARRSTVVTCCAEQHGAEAAAKQAAASAAAVAVAASAAATPAAAYPIFAQQNYANPLEPTGKLACANCHLQGKYIEVRTPHEVLPDTIFKVLVEVPCKYEKRVQPVADGSKGPLNIGAIAVMPEGFRLAPKDRLPKALKKEMKGLAWSPYSKEKPNIVVAGPVPGKIYGSGMVLPVLTPDPQKDTSILYNKYAFAFGGNRGRGQVYPEGNLSNVNMFTAAAEGTVSAVEAEKVVITKADGSTVDSPVGKGSTVVVEVGEKVKKDEQLTTNPNVGGFGQEEKEITLQDMNRVYAYCALTVSIFLAQLSFVLKKKQFEKVQLAEGF